MNQLRVSTDKTELNLDFIVDYLQQESYWAKDRTKAEIEKTITHSFCFGLYLEEKQIGFARILTDQVIFSYLSDVFIAKEYQGNKYGQYFIDQIYQHPQIKNVQKHYLITFDAQRFYQKLGFDIYPNPERFMIKKRS